MISAIMAWTGYWIGIGIELFVIVVATVVLVLMLTGILFNWLVILKAKNEARAEARAAAKAEREEAEAARAAEEAALAEAEAEALEAEAEIAAAEEETVEEPEEETAETEEAPAEESTSEESAPAEEVTEEVIEEEVTTKKSRKKKTKKVVEEEITEEVVEDGAAAGENGGVKTEVVYVQGDGVVFNDSKTITELYEELSAEQKSYFDELREEALTKPDAELSMSRNFVAVKIGKRNLIKLLIKRGVTVAEFMLENEALRQLRLSNQNRRGKSTIKVKPTAVQVFDLPSLKVAIDTLNLAYEELMLND